MKSVIVYGATLFFVFILVSGAMIVLNNKYESMFEFDFSPKGTAAEAARQDSLKNARVRDSLKLLEEKNIRPSPEHTDSSGAGHQQANSSLTGTVSEPLASEHNTPETEKLSGEHTGKKTSTEDNHSSKKGKKDEVTQVKSPVYSGFMKDSAYTNWKRTTLSLYDGMNSKLVAKVISGFSDDIARDLIYSMKKKKASEVLSYLSPEQVARYTRVIQ